MKNAATWRWFVVRLVRAGGDCAGVERGDWGKQAGTTANQRAGTRIGAKGGGQPRMDTNRHEWEGTFAPGRREFRELARIGEGGGQGRRRCESGFVEARRDGGERATMAFRVIQDISGSFRVIATGL